MALQLFKIDSVEVSSPMSSITFSNIPTGYTDLIIKTTALSPNGLDSMFIRFNGDTAANYSSRVLRGSGTVGSSYVLSDFGISSGCVIGYSNQTTTPYTYNSIDVTIPNYRSSNYKSLSADAADEANAVTAYQVLASGLWSSTAAITSITLFLSTYSFTTNSTFTLYGVL